MCRRSPIHSRKKIKRSKYNHAIFTLDGLKNTFYSLFISVSLKRATIASRERENERDTCTGARTTRGFV